MIQLLAPFILCAAGTYFTFFRFWHGFDAISGDIGDPRFNTYVLEHTWLWFTNTPTHAALFDMPMFFPHPNVYAYSDFMLGFAPLYWIFRALHCEPLLAYQWWLITCGALNFAAFFALAKKYFKQSTILSALGAFIFAYSLPRITHLGHAQLMAQFFIVISAMGALSWWRNPKSKAAPWLFATGAFLQFISAFYFLWFWVFTLAILATYVVINKTRRSALKTWFVSVPLKNIAAPFFTNAALATPFLYHYALSAREFGGRREWVSISNTVPRLYSWLSFPPDHWEWKFVPFKEWIGQLPMANEHYLSFGLLTWVAMIAALIWVYRRKPELKYLAIPLIAMFLFTITSGRFSTWVFVSYLFPGGGVVRAVGRIQIFMLLFWALIFMLFLSHLFASPQRRAKAVAAAIVIAFFSENIYVSDWVFSRAHERERLDQIAKTIPEDCEVIVEPSGFSQFGDYVNIDAVTLAFQTKRATMNGYSGHEPKNFRESMGMLPEVSKMKKTCVLERPVL